MPTQAVAIAGPHVSTPPQAVGPPTVTGGVGAGHAQVWIPPHTVTPPQVGGLQVGPQVWIPPHTVGPPAVTPAQEPPCVIGP